MAALNIDAAGLMRAVTVRIDVSGLRALRVRMWLGLLIVRLGVRIIGCRVEVGRPDGED